MSQAKRDENFVTTLIGVSSLDLVTPTLVAVNPTTGALIIESDSNVDRSLIVPPTVTTISNATETTVLSAVAATYLDVYGVLITNTSATATEVDFRDATGGTVRFTISAPANDTLGIALPSISPQTTVNNNWTAQAADSVTSLKITLFAIKNT